MIATVAFCVHAQVRWDVGAEVGAIERFTTGRPPAAKEPDIGPAFELQSHVALLPMVRLGAYVAQDVSPEGGVGVRTFWEAGLHLKVTPPLLPTPWRLSVFAGLGYAYTYAASYRADLVTNGAIVEVFHDGAHGGMLDVPVGVGLARRLVAPWVLFAELGGRFGVGFYGPMYDAGGPHFLGRDSFALSFSVGLSLEK